MSKYSQGSHSGTERWGSASPNFIGCVVNVVGCRQTASFVEELRAVGDR